ncbi:hypothetical protein [Rhizobium phaseoli]|uniref:XRE family transcriptional regulator n=1 Tax=Rhizobium phaseoli TaxID=396 RepID=A0ABM6CFP4_9HYPH|nr:hypothetical protein [Rhizobium phaseoli]ANL87075.1 hypothetical protein AMC81_PA00052 [Rhizobium phaseoli]ANL93584.1 hypothetical protein AMC80_PA00052 [Rhizobium phaseoli]
MTKGFPFIEYDTLARFVTKDRPRELVRAKFLASGEFQTLLEEGGHSVEVIAAQANIDPADIERLLANSLDVDLDTILKAVAAVRYLNDTSH